MQVLISRVLVLVLAGASLLTAPARSAEPNRQRPALQEVWARTELYFGTARPGGEVSDDEFREFMDEVVTPAFPDGLTLLTGYGQFLGSTGTLVKERSKVLILLYPMTNRDADKLIQEIRRRYKQDYGQESVLRVDSLSMVSF